MAGGVSEAAEKWLPEIMKLGLFASVPEADYFAIPAVSSTALKAGRRSIAHMRHTMLNPKSPSPAMELGTAVHMALLEPARFDKTYAFCAEDCDKRAKAWKSHAEWCEENGKVAMTFDDLVAVSAMVRNAKAHPKSADALNTPGMCEYVAVWQDPDTGLAAKARLDKYVPGALALDIKTTRNASVPKFSKDVEWLGYFQQLAWYREGFARASGKETPFTIVAIENEAPYCVNVFSLDDDSYECGRIVNHAVLRKYADAVKSQVFPGYEPIIHEIGISDYAKRSILAGTVQYDPTDTGGL